MMTRRESRVCLASIPPTIVFMLLQKPFMSGFAIAADK